MRQYLELMQDVLDNGTRRKNRTGVDTFGVFGRQVRYNVGVGFPAVTTKRLAFKQVVGELIGFIRGYSDVQQFQALGCTIWDENAAVPYWTEKARYPGDLGRIYGVQWRDWRTNDCRSIDQLADVIERIKRDPTDRRLIVSAWNPGEIEQMALPPCHAFMHFSVDGPRLNLLMYQRSCDLFLGVPFNVASYALLLHIVAHLTGLQPGEFVHSMGDVHIYQTHLDQVREQLGRKPLPLPKLLLAGYERTLDTFEPGDFNLAGYHPHPAIKAPMAV